VAAARPPGETGLKPCVFCEIAAGRAAASRVAEADDFVAFLDHRPLFPGHVLVAPRAHHETLPDLPAGALGPLFALVQRLCRAVPEAAGAEGSFVAVNNAVSQSVPHLHVHVVPRRRGDGLRGFFWPRRPYRDAAHRDAVAAAIRDALARASA
jgi:histidine triad (HIT) family protein